MHDKKITKYNTITLRNKFFLTVIIFFSTVCTLSIYYNFTSTKNTFLWLPTKLKFCPDVKIPPYKDWVLEEDIRSFNIVVDVDGDKLPDSLKYTYTYGNLYSYSTAELTLSKNGESIKVKNYGSIEYIASSIPIPEKLLTKKHRCALKYIEAALFNTVSEKVDPSLEWYIKKQKQFQWEMDWERAKTDDYIVDIKDEIKWYYSPPQFPSTYTVRVRGRKGVHWVSYAGHTHKSYRKPKIFEILAQDGNRILLGTAHGVILSDKDFSKHAWIYISDGGHKLRWDSIYGAKLKKNIALIYIRGDLLKEGEKPEVRIDLTTGKIVK